MVDEDHFLESTAGENTSQVLRSVRKESDADGFLHRTSHIATRACNLSYLEQDVFLDIIYDTDGIVLELTSLRSVKFQTSHVYCLPHGIMSLKYIYSMLKKHLCLKNYNSGQTLTILRKCRGVQLFYESTWECYAALIPVKNRTLGHMDEKDIIAVTFEVMKRVFDTFKQKLYLACQDGKVVNTLKKNSLATMTQLHITPDEQNDVLDILDEALRSVRLPEGFELYLYAFKFGERKTGTYDLRGIFDISFIRTQTIHVAATFSLCYDLGILWSRDGIQRLVGNRGCLLSALTFKEAANFQTNLDGRSLDVSPVLRNLVCLPDQTRFVQFYGDVAHNYPSTVMHPVSGSIVTAGMLHLTSRKYLERDALKYMAVCKDNILIQGPDLKSRLEFVVAPESPLEVIEPSELFVPQNISDLLAREAMFIPFNMRRGEFMKVIQRVGLYLVSTLTDCFNDHKRTGHFLATWTAFQCECAIEKFFWGRGFCSKSRVHAVNLGPGSETPSRSLTDHLGFLALEEPTSSSFEESPPPLTIWCKTDQTLQAVGLVFGLADQLQSAYPVLGSKLILILLKELHLRKNSFLIFGEFLSTLKASDSTSRPNVREKVSVGYLSFNLSKCKGLKSAFGRALDIVSQKEEGIDLVEILSCGIIEMSLKIFPKFKQYNSSRNQTLTWNGVDVWQVHVSNETAAADKTSAIAITCDVVNELEHHGLVHASKFRTFQILEFPWINPMLRKLKGCKLTHDQIQTIALFISSIALLQQGWYVDFKALVNLEGRLPLGQHKLRALEIQSQYLLGPVRKPRLWKIHESISIKLSIKENREETTVTQNKPPQEEEEVEREELFLANTEKCVESDETPGVVISSTRHIPGGSKLRWSPDELEIIYDVRQNSNLKNLKNQYKFYQKLCQERGVPDRPLLAFKKKLYRM
ncbi:hypothetical protein SNE40_017418 [Patella caerulea]|uniref:Uncharacterized protein n=1 Tax=Patella caerulea TaxID=87958 RepID=A0AAN8PFS9_PATCE